MISAEAPQIDFEEIGSTNAEAVRRAETGDLGPVWLRADHQTAGRGRRGRTWVSETGNLFITYLGPSNAPAGKLALLSFAAALAVADVVDAAVGRPVSSLKWPNDVMVDDAKLSGILIESGSGWFALGVGLNLASSPTLDRAVSSLSALAERAVPVADAASALKGRLAYWAQELMQRGFEPLRKAWLARATGLGGVCRARLGAEEIDGVFAGLDGDGALELRLHDGRIRRIAAGEVFFGRKGRL